MISAVSLEKGFYEMGCRDGEKIVDSNDLEHFNKLQGIVGVN